jgi:hypothetical protein
LTIPGDNPIRHAVDDAIGRAPSAKSFAKQVLALDASEGVVVGVLGPWGSGKTSFVNLARDEFESAGATVLDFNPWMFSGAEQLVESFFIELSAQLRVRPGLGPIGDDLAEYGEAFSGLVWLPVVGPWIERSRGVAKVLGKALRRRREGAAGRRDKLTQELSKLKAPIIVVLDDIDRLSTSEIRDVFKLVRLTASFPNVIYVLAFDRKRVEQALGEQGVPGRDYLEKILQVGHDLPAVPPEILDKQIFTALDSAIARADEAPELDASAWPDVFVEVIRPLVRNMRDVRRYAAAVEGTLSETRKQVALVDLLAIEAIRVFLPDVFSLLSKTVEALTTPSTMMVGGTPDPPELKEAIDRLLDSAADRQAVIRSLIERLFPFAARHLGGSSYGGDYQKRYIRERRIAHEAVLRLYLERLAGPQLRSFLAAEGAWEVMNDREKFDEALRAEPEDQQGAVAAALENYEDEYRPEHVVPGCIVLWNLWPGLPDPPARGMFDLESRFVIGRVTYRLLRSLGDPTAVEAAAREILPELSSLSAKWEVITDVGYRENAGHELVSEPAAAQLEADWREEVRAATAADFVAEPDLLRVLIFARRDVSGDEPALELPDDPDVTRQLLLAARSDTRSQAMDSRAVTRSPRLAWDVLIEVVGGEEQLKNRLEALKAAGVMDDDSDLIELADRYAAGWRPDE